MDSTAFYNEYYLKAETSRAHSVFCETVYGKDLCQHGMADIKQIELMIQKLNLCKTSIFLDLGCGCGAITNYIQTRSACTAIGIDNSQIAITNAKKRFNNKKISFICDDFENYKYENDKYDAIALIDSHYFIEDLFKLLNGLRLALSKEGRIAVFSDEGSGIPDIDDSKTKVEETIIGKYLVEQRIPFEGITLTRENSSHWKLKKEVLLKMKNDFLDEGNERIYKSRLNECLDHNRNYDSRFLYIIGKTEYKKCNKKPIHFA
jgi:cyclopropane fatty-acyl-phospholipid synthase-like methyltransferase